ncbi:type II toxin-antitoxin system RelE family toxin [Polaribacter glomeratus]|uniref:Plasmid stabilization protein n=1 Tax=Polaribacter glomeratus TaxID=102 RepID=A0A2S7WH36_9FLAO|nr:plasmid stabilization protein [Polaribacter glomeratus]PQJ76927.1 plasmid stabilization protein [Polaribacter glomeratus]TXD67226.1 plasmid stabilization protein [Polaribacter glomeratus]
MEILYLRQALKDVNKVKNSKLKTKLAEIISDIKSANDLSEISSVKKISGHPEAYRIRIGDYRLGIFYSDEIVTVARFLKRNDIYKLFP